MKIAVGDIVIDDLTGKKAKVIKILSATGLTLKQKGNAKFVDYMKNGTMVV